MLVPESLNIRFNWWFFHWSFNWSSAVPPCSSVESPPCPMRLLKMGGMALEVSTAFRAFKLCGLPWAISSASEFKGEKQNMPFIKTYRFSMFYLFSRESLRFSNVSQHFWVVDGRLFFICFNLREHTLPVPILWAWMEPRICEWDRANSSRPSDVLEDFSKIHLLVLSIWILRLAARSLALVYVMWM